MLSFIRNFFWPAREQVVQQPEVAAVPLYIVPEENRKRRQPDTDALSSTKKHRGLQSSVHISWNLDLEQADYTFSKETLSIFKGSGATVLVNRQAKQGFRPPPAAPAGQSLFASPANHWTRPLRAAGHRSACGVAPSHGGEDQAEPDAFAHSRLLLTGQSTPSVLRQLTNLPVPGSNLPPPVPPVAANAAAAATGHSSSSRQQQQAIVHSTPLMATKPKKASGRASAGKATSGAAASAGGNIPKGQAPGGDDDCVITSVEPPAKSSAEMFSPCKYLSSDWLSDVKTSSQSLKSYMRKVETEETLKMQYWAKRREADERDLVARVTRNLKLAERELPVLPYKYEEPPPTPPPTPPPEEVEEEAAEPEFPDLTPDQLGAVERAWSRQLPGGEVLAEGFSLRVTREELRSLSGLNWLNDNVVNFYMQLIAARSGPGLPRVHAYSTFFYTKLSSSGYATVRRWTRKVDIFDRDVLLCPVHLHNNHWTLCIVDLRSRHIIFLDSLSRGGGGGNASCLPLLRQYLAEEHRDKKGSELDVSDFKLVREIGAPQQDNGSDCGVFCCKFADYYCKGREFTFGQDNMPYFRKRATVEILEKQLLW